MAFSPRTRRIAGSAIGLAITVLGAGGWPDAAKTWHRWIKPMILWVQSAVCTQDFWRWSSVGVGLLVILWANGVADFLKKFVGKWVKLNPPHGVRLDLIEKRIDGFCSNDTFSESMRLQNEINDKHSEIDNVLHESIHDLCNDRTKAIGELGALSVRISTVERKSTENMTAVNTRLSAIAGVVQKIPSFSSCHIQNMPVGQ